jgi:hypothetical protein
MGVVRMRRCPIGAREPRGSGLGIKGGVVAMLVLVESRVARSAALSEPILGARSYISSRCSRGQCLSCSGNDGQQSEDGCCWLFNGAMGRRLVFHDGYFTDIITTMIQSQRRSRPLFGEVVPVVNCGPWALFEARLGESSHISATYVAVSFRHFVISRQLCEL